jgi:hypothetical protein
MLYSSNEDCCSRITGEQTIRKRAKGMLARLGRIDKYWKLKASTLLSSLKTKTTIKSKIRQTGVENSNQWNRLIENVS